MATTTGKTIETRNPATDEVIETYEGHDESAVGQRIRQAHQAHLHNRSLGWDERSERMRKAAGILRDRQAEFAALMTREMGKPITQAEAEVEKCAWVCEFYAEHAEEFLTPEASGTDAARSYVRFDPLGVVLAIMPWNFPFWQVFRFAAPALMAGNTGLLKHASNVAGCALAIEEIFAEAGFAGGSLPALLISSDTVGQVISAPEVRAVTLTGSDRAGRAVAAQAGERLKKCVLELGGSDPFIVLTDADLPAAVETAVKARTQNTGQSCIAAKRFIVEKSVAGMFTEQMIDRMERLRIGDPTERETDIGPMARPDLVEDLHDQVTRSVEQGAELKLGGERLDRPGCYYAPTVLTGVRPGMAAFDEETFGPVAAIIEVADADEAIELANLSRFGLGASLWTGDVSRGEELAARIESGCLFINEMVKSDPRVPFGGVKDSGYGRELAAFGIREFTNIKTVWVA